MNLKKITLRLLALATILLVFNGLYSFYIWHGELSKEGPELQKLLRIEDSCDIIYFGESSNISFDPVHDTIRTSISGLIADAMPNVVIGDITHEAYHAGIYLSLIKRIHAHSKVKTIVVTLNLRTLDQACIHSELETALQKQALYYSDQPPVIVHLRAALNDYDHVSVHERDYRMWKQWMFDTLEVKEIEFPYPTIKTWCEAIKFPFADGKENMPKRTMADHYIKAYAFVATDKNPRVRDLDKIADVCKTLGKNIVFHLLAENTAYADSFCGKSMVQLMKYNRDFLVKHFDAKGVTVIDNLETVSGMDFRDQNWTTEHYNFNGRKAVAAKVVQGLKNLN